MSDVYAIAAGGMAAQRTQLDLIAENLANAGVVRADGGTFHQKMAVLKNATPFEPVFSTALEFDDAGTSELAFDEPADEPAGVAVADIVEREHTPQYRFDPGNPFAARSGTRKGYVQLPDIDPIEQMVSLVSCGRAYDANVAMLQAAKQMDIEASDVGRA